MTADECTFIRERIEAVERQIVAVEDAIDALNLGVSSYQLDTGQTRQIVTSRDVGKLSDLLDSMMSRRDILYARLNGGGTRVVPGF